MNSTFDLMLADAEAQAYYWVIRYFAWFLWGLLFSGIGMFVVRLLWRNRRLRAEELEKENKELRRELADMERQLKGRV